MSPAISECSSGKFSGTISLSFLSVLAIRILLPKHKKFVDIGTARICQNIQTDILYLQARKVQNDGFVRGKLKTSCSSESFFSTSDFFLSGARFFHKPFLPGGDTQYEEIKAFTLLNSSSSKAFFMKVEKRRPLVLLEFIL